MEPRNQGAAGTWRIANGLVGPSIGFFPLTAGIAAPAGGPEVCGRDNFPARVLRNLGEVRRFRGYVEFSQRGFSAWGTRTQVEFRPHILCFFLICGVSADSPFAPRVMGGNQFLYDVETGVGNGDLKFALLPVRKVAPAFLNAPPRSGGAIGKSPTPTPPRFILKLFALGVNLLRGQYWQGLCRKVQGRSE